MAVVLNSSDDSEEGWSNRRVFGVSVLFLVGIIFLAVLLDGNDARNSDLPYSNDDSSEERRISSENVDVLRQRAAKIRSELEGYQVDVWPTIGVVKGSREEPDPWYSNERIRRLRHEFALISRQIRHDDKHKFKPPSPDAGNAGDTTGDEGTDEDVLPPRTQGAFAPLDGAETINGGMQVTAGPPPQAVSAIPAEEGEPGTSAVPLPGSAPPGPYLLATDNWGVQSIIFTTPGMHVIERSPVDWKDGCKYARDWYGVEVNHDRSKFRAVVGSRCSEKHFLGGEQHSKWSDISSADEIVLNSTNPAGSWIKVHTTVLPPARWALVRVGSVGGTFHEMPVEAGIVEYQVSAVYPTSDECKYPRDFHAVELKAAKLRAITANRCGSDSATGGEVHGDWVALDGHSHAIANRELRTDATVVDLHWQNM